MYGCLSAPKTLYCMPGEANFAGLSGFGRRGCGDWPLRYHGIAEPGRRRWFEEVLALHGIWIRSQRGDCLVLCVWYSVSGTLCLVLYVWYSVSGKLYRYCVQYSRFTNNHLTIIV